MPRIAPDLHRPRKFPPNRPRRRTNVYTHKHIGTDRDPAVIALTHKNNLPIPPNSILAEVKVAHDRNATGGRPLQLLQPSDTDPSKTKYDVAVAYAAKGINIKLAAATVGVDPTTIRNWENRGKAIAENVLTDPDYARTLTGNEKIYWSFYCDLLRAHAKFTSLVANKRANIALHGRQTVTTTYAWVDKLIVGKDGKEKKVKVKEKIGEKVTVADDPATTDSWLASHYPEMFKVPKQVELMGKDGGPIVGVAVDMPVHQLLGALDEEAQIKALEAYDRMQEEHRLVQEKLVGEGGA